MQTSEEHAEEGGMSEPNTPYGQSGSYSGPPTYGPPSDAQPPEAQYPQYAQPQYGQPQYPTAAYPQQPYGQQPPQQYAGYPPNPYGAYPPGYPPAYGGGPQRPGLVIAASVLGYVLGGLMVIAGALLLFGGSAVSDLENDFNSGTDYGTELALDGIVNLVAAGLLIGGAVAFTAGRSLGRTLLTIGNVIVVVAAIYWLVRFSGDEFDGVNDGFIVWAVIFATVAILGLAFSFVGAINSWLRQTAR